jgi:hypothetical protein
MKIENAILAPNHPVLNTLIKSMTKDFEGWKQEQGCILMNLIKPSPYFYLQRPRRKSPNGALFCLLWKRILYLYRFKFI